MASSANIRIPTPEEIPRVALVAAAGFYYSPVNAYERPNRDKYPRDMMGSYWQEVFDYLWEPKGAVLIIEDEYDENEDTKLPSALQKDYSGQDWFTTGSNGKVIVGFMSVKFKPGSSRIGQYQPEGDRPKVDWVCELSRDHSVEGVKNLQSQIAGPIDKHLADIFTVDYLAVHPMYWRRGHGSSLLAWAAKLADEDNIQLGVASVPMGVKNAEKVGFKEREVIEVKGYSEHPENFKIWIGIREPRTLNASVEDVSDSGQ